MKDMKNKKSTGIFELPIELFKCLHMMEMVEIAAMCKKLYDNGIWSQHFVRLITLKLTL